MNVGLDPTTAGRCSAWCSAPARGLAWWGVGRRGRLAARGWPGERDHVRPRRRQAAIAVASRSHRDAETDGWLAAEEITDTVSAGSSLKFCLVAEGKADVYPRFGPTMEWDTAAGDAVLRAAGGAVITTATARRSSTSSPASAIRASSPRALEEPEPPMMAAARLLHLLPPETAHRAAMRSCPGCPPPPARACRVCVPRSPARPAAPGRARGRLRQERAGLRPPAAAGLCLCRGRHGDASTAARQPEAAPVPACR